MLGLVAIFALLLTDAAAAAVSVDGLRVERKHLDRLGSALAAQDQATPNLLSRQGVVGTAVGLDAKGEPVVKIFTERAAVFGLPFEIDGVSTQVEVTGQIVAQHDPQARNRPASVGDSIGHPDVTAGTIAALVTDGTGWYLLSNNHVLADENAATIGDPILQPGAVDGGTVGSDEIGTLADYEPLSFCGIFCLSNGMDAAITRVLDLSDVDVGTWCGWIHSTSATAASVGQQVKKCGRTTGATTGEVTEINATLDVLYGSGRVARFTNQIVTTDMSTGGDSGSLIVEQGTNRPVALLFAGGDTRTIASPIQPILDEFGVRFEYPAPVADFSAEPTGGTVPLTVEFADESSGNPTSWEWDLDGDGDIDSTEQNPSFTYTNAGDYTVTLTASNANGADVETKTDLITAALAPNALIADFTASPTSGTSPFVVEFTDTSSGNPTAWWWDFNGDGEIDSTLQNPSATFVAPGSYTIELIVSDGEDSDVETKTNYITVDSASAPPPPPEPTPLPPGGGGTPAATDLAVELTTSAPSVEAGGVVALRASVANKHAAWDATGVTLELELPAGAIVESAKSTGGLGCRIGGTVKCDLDFVRSGTTTVVDLVVRFTEVGEWTTKASVSSAEVDLEPSDNQGLARTIVVDVGVRGASSATELRIAITGRSGRALRPKQGRHVATVRSRVWISSASTVRVRVLPVGKPKALKLLRRSRVGKTVSTRAARTLVYRAPRAKGVRLKLRLRSAIVKSGRVYRIEVRATDSNGQRVRKVIRFRA